LIGAPLIGFITQKRKGPFIGPQGLEDWDHFWGKGLEGRLSQETTNAKY